MLALVMSKNNSYDLTTLSVSLFALSQFDIFLSDMLMLTSTGLYIFLNKIKQCHLQREETGLLDLSDTIYVD